MIRFVKKDISSSDEKALFFSMKESNDVNERTKELMNLWYFKKANKSSKIYNA